MQIRKFIEEKAGHTITVMRPGGALLLTLAAALAFWLFLAAVYHKEAIDDISKSLIKINSYKTAQISDWLEQHRREALRLSRHPFLGEILSREISSPGSKRARLTTWLSDHTAQKRYSAMAFLSAKGAVIAGTPGYPPGTEPYFKTELTQAARTGAARLTDLYLGADGRPRLTMFSPITAGGRGGKPLCVLAIQIDPAEEFYPLLTATPLLFTKAETLLVRKEGEYVLFLNELEQAKDSALKLRRPLSEAGLPAAAALTGRTGFFAGTDYRGEKVFSALDRIEDSHYAVITKIDRSTVLGPVKLREYLALGLTLLAAVLTYGFVYAVVLGREWTGREKLREGERRLAALFSNLPGVAYRCANTRDWTMEFLSEGCFGLTGYQPEELVGNPLLNFNELIAPQDRERVWSAIQGSLAESGKYKVAYALKCKDGSFKSVWEQGGGIKGRDGAFEKLEGFISDITPLKRAQQALQISEKIFREFMEHSPIYVFFKDENIRPMHLSRNYETMIGRPLDQLLGKSMDELFPSELAKNMVADDRRILKEGKEVSVEEKFNGRTYRTIKFPIRIEGRPPYLAGYTIDITEQKLAEETVKASERELKEAQKIARIGNWTLELASSKLYWSDEIFRIFEVDQERFGASYDAFLDAIHPDDKELVNAAYTDSLKTRSRYDITHRLLMKDGRIKYVNECCETFYDAEERPLRSVGTVQDITERKLAEEALKASEATVRAKLQSLLSPEGKMEDLELGDIFDIAGLQGIMDEFYKLTNIGIGIIDLKGKVLVATGWQDICTKFHRVNPETARYCVESDTLLTRGVEPGTCRTYLCKNHLRDIATPITVGGKHVGNIFLGQFLYKDEPYDLDLFRAQARRYGFDEKEYVAAYERMPRFSREQVDVTMRFYSKLAGLISDLSYGKIKLAKALARSKRAEEALRRSNTLMTSTQSLAKIGGWEWDLADQTMHWTEETYRIHDFAPGDIERGPEEHIARSRQCYRPEDRQAVMQAFERCAGTGEPYDMELPFTSAKGRRLWIRTTGKAEKESGRITKIIGTLSDITEKKQAELELKRINQALFSKKQEMENFLYITTHDLRSPLVNIQGFSQNLERYIKELLASIGQAPLPEEARQTLDKLAGERIPEALTYVRKSSRKMDALISALLKVSRMGRVEMKPEILEVNGLLQTTLDSLRYQLEEAGGKIEIGALPQCRADQGAVNQLFTNLLDNAIKYRHKARPLVIRVTGEVKGTSVLYTVSDNGAGIPQGDLPKIWDIFYRPRGTGDTRGEGIGLPMVRRIAERNGGSIKAESKEGEGSVFYVELPGPGEV